MKRYCMYLIPIIIGMVGMSNQLQAQFTQEKANYNLASRFSPTKIGKMLFSTSVTPNWLKKSDRFWYVYKTTAGQKWYLVDPAKATRKELFDANKMAANISRIVKDPYDAQNLKLNGLEFTKDEKSIRFSVTSSSEMVDKKPDTAQLAKQKADSLLTAQRNLKDSLINGMQVKRDTLNKLDTLNKRDTLNKKDTSRTKTAVTPPGKELKTYYFEYNLETQELKEVEQEEKPKSGPGWASIAPDSSVVIFSRNYNLYMMDKTNFLKAVTNEKDSTIIETQLTTDGVEDFAYGRYSKLFGTQMDSTKRNNAGVLWSPDSRHFAMAMSDVRKVKDLWVVNNLAHPRPTLLTYKYHMPGEVEAPVDYVILGNTAAKTIKKLNIGRYKDQSISMMSKQYKRTEEREDGFRPSIWYGSDTGFLLTRTSRDLKRIDICMATIHSDTLKPLIEEHLNTYVEIQRVYAVENGKEYIHWSERDGWAHFYLFDKDGKLKNQITSGPFHCENIVEVDEKNRVLYFTANGKEASEDPYFQHLYRVNFDGSGLKLLNPGDFDHSIAMVEGGRYFVDNFSRVNTVPESALYDQNGKKIMTLEKADFSQINASGYKFPEPFQVKADDGITDLYGVMYKPFDFDSTKSYPIIAYVYPGPQTEAVNKAFGKSMDRIDRLAQLGFVVITVGNRGGHPARSKWYHNYGYGNLRDYGLADKKTTIEQLAVRYPFIDGERVGITGHSGGGFMSTAAMLVYPDFFKVAVSGAGNHENNIYNRWWSEKHHGVKEIISAKGDTTFQYNIDRNTELAGNLKGKLLLVTGDMDNNVHPANTIRMANALIRENKRFDFMLMPGQAHSFGDMTEYFFWMMADYFSKHLLGDTSQPVDMMEMNRDQPQNKSKKKN